MPDRLPRQINTDIDAGKLEFVAEPNGFERFRTGKILDPNIQISAIIAKLCGQVFPGLVCKLFKINKAWRSGGISRQSNHPVYIGIVDRLAMGT